MAPEKVVIIIIIFTPTDIAYCHDLNKLLNLLSLVTGFDNPSEIIYSITIQWHHIMCQTLRIYEGGQT